MDDWEKAINALERAWNYIDVQKRTYASVFKGGSLQTFDDVLSGVQTALALLKAQEPRVMTFAEAIEREKSIDDYGCFVESWEEDRDGFRYTILFPGIICNYKDGELRISDGLCRDYIVSEADYNKEVRCWTTHPTDEEMDETPWDD